ncbi:MAG: glycosyltransferase [Lachnospiraceae bacterium]
MTVDVIIPTYKPDATFGMLIDKLQVQDYPIRKIIVINTQEEFWRESYVQKYENIELHHIQKAAFDHGGTRAWAASLSEADIMVFMTQDAMPGNSRLLTNLLKPFEDPDVRLVASRQLPAEGCHEIERYTRAFNYPLSSRKKTSADLPQLGIKTYFCSNVCAAYDRKTYDALGGFVKRTIFNEDMIYAAAVISAGYALFYTADAEVIHSHNYTLREQFSRNFDLGVSQAEFPEVFGNLPSEGEGIRLVKSTALHLLAIGRPWLIAYLIAQSASKYLGYRKGKRYKSLSRSKIKKYTMNPGYWDTKQ